MQAQWRDRESWSRPIEGTRQTELGLGLQVAGRSGTVFVAFAGRLDQRNPALPPAEMTLQVSVGKLSNPTIVRRPTLRLDVDPDEDTRVVFDLSRRMIVDDPTPGAIVENGVATLRASDFSRLCDAKVIKGEALGFEMTFRDDQIEAVRALGDRLHLIETDKKK
jgi:hypothetical protein